MRFRKLTIIRAPAPKRAGVNEQLQWLGGSLGLFSPRDRDKSCFRIFITLLKGAKRHEELSSDELADLTGLSRGTVVHHLNNLIGQGIVDTYKSKYILRVETLQELLGRLEEDLDTAISSMKDVAKDIDEKLKR